ncbi:hypothetical protein TcWFU_008326 [Taenia crassiceps]|uniref:Uncharacterized protein n=1 Tax=Taenia crassiceps TaxID=6207 RepID=A0ABR4QBG8_9CEST
MKRVCPIAAHPQTHAHMHADLLVTTRTPLPRLSPWIRGRTATHVRGHRPTRMSPRREHNCSSIPPRQPTLRTLVTQHKRVKLSTRFKRLLVVAAALPLLALILVICSTLSPQWERLEFLFDRLIQRACLRQTKTTWRLAHVVLEGGGSRVTRFDNHTRWEICHRWKETPPTIVGVGIYPGCAQNATLIEVFNVLGGAFQVCNEKQGE